MAYRQVACSLALFLVLTPAFFFAASASEEGGEVAANVEGEPTPATRAQDSETEPAADPQKGRDGARSRLPPGFEPVEGGPSNTVDANRLVVLAYAAFFALMFGYVVWIARDQSKISRDLATLAERLRRQEEAPRKPS